MRRACAVLVPALLLAGGPAPARALPARAKAILYSLAVPGAGHWYMGRTSRAQIFGAAELGVWTAFATFKVQGHLRKEDYIEMAEVKAGVGQAHGRSSAYYRSLGLYASSDDYNMIEVEIYARYTIPDPEERAAYVREHLITGDAAWRWTSDEWQQAYRERRADSEGAYQNAKYAFAVGLLNRLVSAVDAARLSAKDGASGDAAPVSPEAPALTFGLTDGGVPYAAMTARF